MGKQKMAVTCYIEMSIAGGFANFVRDDAFIDTTMCMPHRADDQAVDIADCRRKQRANNIKHTGLEASSARPYLVYFW